MWLRPAGGAGLSSVEGLRRPVAAAGVVRGVGGGRYDPTGLVSREQMATFVVRAFEALFGRTMAAPRSDLFSDDEGSVHEDNINRVALAGIARGSGDGRYGPGLAVRRGQMATFVSNSARFLDHLGAWPDPPG